MKRVSVVILNWNGVDMLRKFMPSVIDNSVGEGIEICVADNASSDGSLEMLRTEFPVVRLIELDRNYGFAEGYNRALAQVDAEYVVLLNSDVEVTSHWLEPLLDYMDTHSGTVACQPKLLSWHNKEYFEYAGASGGFIDRYGYPFCRGRIFDVVEKTHAVGGREILFRSVENPRIGICRLIGGGNLRHIRFQPDNHRLVRQVQTLHLMCRYAHYQRLAGSTG